MDKKSVVVTTEFRGVFFGYLEEEPQKLPDEITLSNARMAVQWQSSIRGVLGLASVGPNVDCRIWHSVPKLTLYKTTAVIECTPEAAEKWEGAPWS